MTKKELLTNEVFKALPDDAEIVFGTSDKLEGCVPMTALNLSLVKECVNIDALTDLPHDIKGKSGLKARYKTCLVVDAIPYWYLQERYNVTFLTKEE